MNTTSKMSEENTLNTEQTPYLPLNDDLPLEISSEFSHLYKNAGKGPQVSQQERRDQFLEEQKEKRHNSVDRHRDFSEVFLDEENEFEDAPTECSEDMDVDVMKRARKMDKFFLMRSEWLTDVPSDLESNWLVKLAPEGIRVLLIAKKCRTVLVNERGKVLTLKTNLPGGGLSRTLGLTVLDCIYNKLSKEIFVLDCLYWNTMSVLDSETSFRFYWLKNQFQDSAKLAETNKPHKISVLDFYPADRSLIQEKVFQGFCSPKHPVLVNGVVFYHKELQYIFGQTPLFGWLYSYMLPEKLSIDVPEELLKKMPKDYECLEKYLENLEIRKAELKKERQASFKEKRLEKSRMDVT